MNDSENLFQLPWYRRPLTIRLLAFLFIMIACVESYKAVFKPIDNDFRVYLAFGKDFIQGTPYIHAGNFYPPGRSFLNWLMSVPYMFVTRALLYPLALISLLLVARWWADFAAGNNNLENNTSKKTLGLPSTLWSFVLLLPFILRDLDECGMQTFLLLFLAASAWMLYHQKIWQCGFWLAAAITYKVTPLLFVPLLIWKRQWKATAWTVLFTVLLNVLPFVALGWDGMVQANKTWFHRIVFTFKNEPAEFPISPGAAYLLPSGEPIAKEDRVKHYPIAYPSSAGTERPKIHNLSLRATIARYIETYPEGHPLHMQHAAFMQFGNLSPAVANRIVKIVIVLLGVFVAFLMRKRWLFSAEGSHRFATEWAIACLFAALLSPVCWKQHLVLAYPCAFLAVYNYLKFKNPPRWYSLLLCICGGIILLSRHFVVGREFSIVILSYKIDTFALLALGTAVLLHPSSFQKNVATESL